MTTKIARHRVNRVICRSPVSLILQNYEKIPDYPTENEPLDATEFHQGNRSYHVLRCHLMSSGVISLNNQ